MNSLGHDLTSILNRYVKRKSFGEIKFDEKQKDSGIKVCEHVLHQHCEKENGKDKLRIITQISHVSDNCDTPVPTLDIININCKGESPDQNQNRNQKISEYYLKSIALSHSKSKSLEADNEEKLEKCHKTEITAVVSDSSGKYERVHSTTFIHSSKVNKVEKANSFTRMAASSSSSNSRPASYYSLPSQINSSLIPSTDRLNQKPKKKISISTKWKRLFSGPKSKKINLKDIDKLAEIEVKNSRLSSPQKPESPVTKQDSKKSNLGISIPFHAQTIPFKSHIIGEKLQPLCNKKKKKKIPRFLHSIISPQCFFKMNNEKNNNIAINTIHSIDMDKVGDFKTKGLVADFCKIGENEDVQIQIIPDELDCLDGNNDDNCDDDHEDDEDNDPYNDGSNRIRSISGNVSFSHIDMTMGIKERRPSCPTTQQICNCDDRRKELIVDVLCLSLNKKMDEKLLNIKKGEINDYDVEKCHFVNCYMMQHFNEKSFQKSFENWRLSQASLYSLNPCVMCTDVDGYLSEDISSTLLPILEQLESENEINCPVETIEYFLKALCYKHFEKGLLQIIGTQCTVKNVALLHYLTKRIVKHVGDPTENDNKIIKKIMKNSEKFYLEHYYPHIKNIHKSMESFLISCNDNDEVD